MNKKLNKALSWRGIPLSLISDRHSAPTFHFVSQDAKECCDLELLGFDSSSLIIMHPKFTWANIVSHVGMFSSVGNAKKAGWVEEIEPGYTEAFLSKADGTPLFVFIAK